MYVLVVPQRPKLIPVCRLDIHYRSSVLSCPSRLSDHLRILPALFKRGQGASRPYLFSFIIMGDGGTSRTRQYLQYPLRSGKCERCSASPQTYIESR